MGLNLNLNSIYSFREYLINLNVIFIQYLKLIRLNLQIAL